MTQAQTWAINVVVMWLTPISGVLEHVVVVPLLIERKLSAFIVADVMGWDRHISEIYRQVWFTC